MQKLLFKKSHFELYSAQSTGMESLNNQVPGNGWSKRGYFQMSKKNTLIVPMELHSHNRAKLCARLQAVGQGTGVVLLTGGSEISQYDSDTELLFR